MAIILPESEPKNEANSYISRFFKENKLGSLLNQANIRKADGFSPVFLLQFFFRLSCTARTFIEFLIQTVYQMLLEKIQFTVSSTFLEAYF